MDHFYIAERTRHVGTQSKRVMARKETVRNAEELVERIMKGNDASHDAAHVWRVRDLALTLAREEGLFSSESMEIVSPSPLICNLFASKQHSVILVTQKNKKHSMVAEKFKRKGWNGRKIETLYSLDIGS